MSVNKKQAADRFSVNISDVVQKGSKQLFIVKNYQNNKTILVSYTTIIGLYKDGIWYITTETLSSTTGKQTTHFCSRRTIIMRVDSLEGLF
jgi:hypothetical protein